MFATITVTAMLLGFCPSFSAAAPPPIKLGLVGAMSGGRAAYGTALYGAEAMIRHINETGGIKSMGGAKIDIVWGIQPATKPRLPRRWSV